MTDDLETCRCGQTMPDWEMLGHQIDDATRGGCPYERCDDPTCRALKVPRTHAQAAEALNHWKNHLHLGGCSHGR